MSEQATATMEQMAMPKHGEVCWTEIATNNLEASKGFYAELFGWNFKKHQTVEGSDDMEYYEFSREGEDCGSGGMYRMGKEFGDAPPHWMSYVAVDNVDEAAAKVWELGGKVCVPPTDIPNVGRFCVVNDPTGATFSMITLKMPDGVS
ncbi:MAG TPA: VOC family protein [Pyrinomonadaceae bacterium]|nr:VOC family protein [Pyrinomonadaceae bacterium]